MKTLLVLLLFCLSSVAQNPDAIKYAPRQVLLVDPTPGTEAVLPMMFLTEGKQHLEFVPVHQIKESMDKGGRPIVLADILSALGEATEKINQLQDGKRSALEGGTKGFSKAGNCCCSTNRTVASPNCRTADG